MMGDKSSELKEKFKSVSIISGSKQDIPFKKSPRSTTPINIKNKTMNTLNDPRNRDINNRNNKKNLGSNKEVRSPRNKSPILRKGDLKHDKDAPVSDYELPTKPSPNSSIQDMPKKSDYEGIMTLGMKSILNKIINNNKRLYYLSCSYLEIYNDKVYDL